MNLDLHTSLSWINILHGDSHGLIHLCATADWTGQTFTIGDDNAIGEYIQTADQRGREGIYLRATTLNRQLGRRERGGVDLSATLPGLWADIDIAGPGHKLPPGSRPLPADERQALSILIHAKLPPPTMVVHSGGGLYPWWFIKEPVHIDESNRSQLVKLSSLWQRIIADAAAQLGLHYGSGVGDLARVLRIPGTINRKAGLQRPCRYTDYGTGAQYSLDGLAGALAQATHHLYPKPAQAPLAQRSTVGGASANAPGTDYNRRADWADILVPAGWQLDRQTGDTRYWVRPGKARRDGHSATTGRAGLDEQDRLYVFSDATGFDQNVPYSKFAAYTVLNAGGDFRQAASQLRRLGYGSKN